MFLQMETEPGMQMQPSIPEEVRAASLLIPIYN
jgi:hypothetical protein